MRHAGRQRDDGLTAGSHHRKRPDRGAHRRLAPIDERVDNLDFIALRLQRDLHLLSQPRQRSGGLPRTDAVGYRLGRFVGLVIEFVAPALTLGRDPEAVPAADHPLAFAAPSLLARDLGKNVGTAAKAQAQNARADVTGDDQFDLAVIEADCVPSVELYVVHSADFPTVVQPCMVFKKRRRSQLSSATAP